jgi:hypothetical protein
MEPKKPATRMTKRLTFVKTEQKGKIIICHEELSNTGAWDRITRECNERARPEFYASMERLVGHVLFMLELPDTWRSRLYVNGVRFLYGGMYETMGAVIFASKRYSGLQDALALATPARWCEPVREGGDSSLCLTPACIDALLDLQNEVRLYIQGERHKQLGIFDTKGKSPAVATGSKPSTSKGSYPRPAIPGAAL